MFDLYMPIEDRREVIRQYAKEYGLRCFVETGTADGGTTAALIPDFDILYTVEIDQGLYENAVNQFRDNKNVFCVHGDSGEWLKQTVPFLSQPTLFWLDGHFCGGSTRGEVDSPVIEELVAVVKAPKGSVILIDDARIFGGGPEDGLEGYTGYPQLEWVKKFGWENGFHYQLIDDIIRLTPPFPDV